MKWLKQLFTSPEEQYNSPDANDLTAKVEAIIAETEHIRQESNSLIAQLSDLAPDELSWVEWFHKLPENHKRIVELCGENGIKATQDNFDAILKAIPGDPGFA